MELFQNEAGSPRGATSCTSRAATASTPSGWSSTRRRGPAPSTSRPGTATLREAVDPSLFGAQEPDAVLLGRRAPEDRAEEVPDHPRRLHDLRAADAAVGDAVRVDHAEPRRLRAPEERRVPGEERAADVPAGLLLPDPGGRPRDRVPDADLRHRRRRGDSRSATRSSGRSTAARTRRSSTTGTRRPARGSAANTATCAARARRATRRCRCSTSTRRPTRSRTATVVISAARRSYTVRRRHGAAAAARTCARAPTRTTTRASSRSSATSRTSTRRRTAAAASAATSSGSWSANSLSVTVDRNDYFSDTDVVPDDRVAAAHLVHPRRAGDRRLAAVLRRQQRVRHARAKHQRGRREDERSRA